MRLPPTKGLSHAVFLLVHVASLGRNASKRDWIEAARARPVIAAQSFDLNGIADRLIEWGLIEVSPSVVVNHPLSRLSTWADYPTLKSIAGILLRKRPPAWLPIAIQNGRLNEEVVPIADREALSWLGDDLEAVLVAVYRDICEPDADQMLERLGMAGELAVMNALERAGMRPRQVSLISDAYGYDIEVEVGGQLNGIEVKTVVPRTAAQFFISRNEFEISRRMLSRWRIIQVMFSTAIVAAGKGTYADVLSLRELPSSVLHSLAPEDESHFRWTESALIVPPDDAWQVSELKVCEAFEIRL